MKTSAGFIRIIIFLIVAIALLLFSGIDIRSIVEGFDLVEIINNGKSILQTFYNTHLQQPITRFIILPSIAIYEYTKLYVIDAILNLINSATK